MNKHAGMPEKYFSALGYGEFRLLLMLVIFLILKKKQKEELKTEELKFI